MYSAVCDAVSGPGRGGEVGLSAGGRGWYCPYPCTKMGKMGPPCCTDSSELQLPVLACVMSVSVSVCCGGGQRLS